jgi:hypothetical protein
MGQLVYSIKIPLKNNSASSFDVNYSPGETMNIGFEIETPERENMRRGGKGSGMRGGERPSGGRRGRDARSGMMMKNRPEPIDLKLEILLARDK